MMLNFTNLQLIITINLLISSNIVNDIKEIFSVCSGALYNWINLYKHNEELEPKHSGRPLNLN